MGNGAVFQVVAQRFPEEIGVITGIVGAAGGLGGFVLPNVLGSLRQLTHSYGGGFLAFALAAVSGAIALFFVGRKWGRAPWPRERTENGVNAIACGFAFAPSKFECKVLPRRRFTR
jgi:NNP family nitrate/nitrite transporter-like MFS transporter